MIVHVGYFIGHSTVESTILSENGVEKGEEVDGRGGRG